MLRLILMLMNSKKILKKSFFYFSIILVFASFSLWGGDLFILTGRTINYDNLSSIIPYINQIVILISVLGITYFLTKLVNVWLEKLFPLRRISTAKRVFSYIIWGAAVIFLLTYFAGGGAGTGLSLGLFGAGLSFALQRPILCVVGWLIVIVKKLYREGDRINVGGKIKGDVASIGIMTTTIVEVGGWAKFDQSTGRILTFPNAWVLEKKILNYTSGFDWIWDEVALRIPYDSNWEKAEEILEEIGKNATKKLVEKSKWKMKDTMKKFTLRTDFDSLDLDARVFVDLKRNWIELKLRYICPAGKRRTIRSKISKSAIKEFKKNNLPVTGRTIRVVDKLVPGKPSENPLK